MFIVLATDFGDREGFTGVMKAVILSINPNVRIIDFSHNLEPFNIKKNSFIIGKSYHFFPKHSIFVVVVDPSVGSGRKIILVKTKDYTFLAPDNGILSFLKDEKNKTVIEVKNKRFFLKEVSSTFHGRDIFAPVAGYVSCGVEIDEFGKRINKIKTVSFPKVYIRNNRMIGKILFSDYFGNLVSNIEKDLFEKFIRKDAFLITVSKFKIDKISTSYENKKKKPIAIFDSFDNLEIALPQANAKKKLNIKEGQQIIIKKLK